MDYVRADGLGYAIADVFAMNGRAMLTIPQSLIESGSLDALEDWLLSSPACHKPDGIKPLIALNAWRREQFVRRNVRRETFQQWRNENPRFFITPRERRFLEYLRAKSNAHGKQVSPVQMHLEEASGKEGCD